MSGQKPKISEAEIFELVKKAKEQYAEYIRLAEIPDFRDKPEEVQLKYSWRNPFGLVITNPGSNLLTFKTSSGSHA